ncbi:hypothetical protein LEP1GSC203_1109 [Leptospira terpstrae serovar Hualin str. LT 11-33 = ATCC 700639]|uniref:Uncharacterized protein n=1 Tax=Leptospira terpstrae serovar Hualin str. LT 11-33 = ATCC 700639 TaxID=1257025 RepID=N1VT48_9LEPT|nr:hypothetical protein LEP1GSC203_1109 [Leptospira terpstrae serovar Hualin str. LT 11-33 = ATCC 700639]
MAGLVPHPESGGEYTTHTFFLAKLTNPHQTLHNAHFISLYLFVVCIC